MPNDFREVTTLKILTKTKLNQIYKIKQDFSYLITTGAFLLSIFRLANTHKHREAKGSNKWTVLFIIVLKMSTTISTLNKKWKANGKKPKQTKIGKQNEPKAFHF